MPLLDTTSPSDLVPTLDSILTPPDEKPKNPYLNRLLSRPRLTQGDLDGTRRSLIDRFWIDHEEGYRGGVPGAANAAVYGKLPGQYDPNNPMDVEKYIQADRIQQGHKEFNAMAPARTPLESAVAVAGFLSGAMRDPTAFLSLPTKFVTGGATALSRTLRAGASGTAINVAIDPVVQGLRKEAGLQEEYSPKQTAFSALFGFAIPAGVQTLVEGIRPRIAPSAPERVIDPLEPEVRGEVSAKPTPEQLQEQIDIAAATLRAEADRDIAVDVAPGFPEPRVTFEPGTPAPRDALDGQVIEGTASPELVAAVKARLTDNGLERARARGKEAPFHAEIAAITDSPINWKNAVNQYAELEGYDVVFHSSGEIVVKNPSAIAGATEAGAEGLPQTVIPGAERATDATIAQRRADQPLRPKAAQKGDVGPLFGDSDKQKELFGFVGFRKGKPPLPGELDRSSTGVAAGQGPAAERLKDISERLVDALGLTVRQGRITLRGAQGTFNRTTGVTRIKELDAYDILVHEGGHALHLEPNNKSDIDGIIAAHATDIERLAYAGSKPGTERVEGFAEWFRLWLTNPLFAAKEAPNFTADFTRWMETNRNEQFQALLEAQGAYRDWLQAPSRDMVVGDLVTSAKPPLPPRLAKALGPDRLPTGESLFSFFDRFYTWTIDTTHPLRRGVNALLDIAHRNTGKRIELKANEDAYKLARLATNAYQAGHIDLSHGVVPYRGLDPQGPSFAEALELAVGKNWFGNWRSDDLLDFGGYLVARRSIVEFQRFLAGEVPNPPGKLTLGDYRQAVADFEVAHPNFAAASNLLYQYQTNNLRKKFDAGLVSRSFYDAALAKADYVPFQRDFSEKIDEILSAGTGGTNRQSVMKTYRGSLRSIINPIESIISDAYDTAAIIARNDVVNALDDMAARAGYGSGAIAERIPSHQMKPVSVDIAEALRAAGKDAGLLRQDVDSLIQQAEDALGEDNLRATLFRAGEAPDKGEPIVYGWKGGERYALRLADGRFGKELFRALTQIGNEQSNWVINMLAIPARGLRAGITTSPEFLIANYLRDQISAFVLNTRFVPLLSGARGAYDELRQGRAARLYAQAGGVMGGANVASLDQARIGRSIAALQKKGYNFRRMKDLREVIKFTEVSETGTRIALFRQYFNQARKNGLTEYEALVEGAFQARDYMDFGRHGSKMLTMRRLVTFFNAALQGTDKTLRVLVGDLKPMARVFRGETLTRGERQNLARSVSAWAKISALTALSATYAAMYRDDPEFQEASEYLRATHWLFKTPGGEWVTVPKPYEMSVIMNLGERAAEGLMADDPTWAERWVRSWAFSLTPPLEPAGLMVPAEIMFNYDTFRDRPIVPQWDLGKEPALQFNSYTSEFSKALGKAINVSPAKIDHLIVGWAGSWGRNILASSNAAMDPARRSSELYDWPITGRFVKNLSRGSDATDKFYGLVSETGGRLELKNNTYRAMQDRGQENEAQSYYDGLRDDEKAWVALNAQEKADNKRLHPLRRASDVAGVLSGMRREILGRNVVGIASKQPITVNPTMASAINDQIARVSAAEVRNAMIAVGEPGWAQRQVMDVDQYYDAIRKLSPEVGEEIEARLRKKKVLPFNGVRAVWPELRDRLLKDGPEAFVSDLRGDAMSAGRPRRRSAPVAAPDPFAGVSLRQ